MATKTITAAQVKSAAMFVTTRPIIGMTCHPYSGALTLQVDRGDGIGKSVVWIDPDGTVTGVYDDSGNFKMIHRK